MTTIALSPHGSLYLVSTENSLVPKQIQTAFANGCGAGLKHLGLWEPNTPLPADLAYWRDFSRHYFSQICATPEIAEKKPQELMNLSASNLSNSNLSRHEGELTAFANLAPPMQGGEYLTLQTLSHLWEALQTEFQKELIIKNQNIQEFFSTHNTPWNLVGRVCFHLAENKRDEEIPFAFLATYSHKISTQGKAQHLPLGKALHEYSEEKNKNLLLQLLLPVQKGSEKSQFLKALIDSGDIFHPLAWTPQDAYRFLKDIPLFESAGIIVRVPDWWNAKKPPRPQVTVSIGGKKTSVLGIGSMLKFSVNLTLEGSELTSKEIKQILSSTSGLALIRGKWIDINQEKLSEVLNHWKSVEQASSNGELSFIQGMRLLSGATALGDSSHLPEATVSEWSNVIAGLQLSELLDQLKDPSGKLKKAPHLGVELKTTLRPYQEAGVNWLWFLSQLGLGACLADDMGLGKTIQIISLFLIYKREKQKNKIPNLLVVPASLLGNWKVEVERFAPNITLCIVHPSFPRSLELPPLSSDVVMTTYGTLSREPWMSETSWNCIVLDEAQAIKNAGSRQSQIVKTLKGRHRIALTGTPIENHLSDLWSLYDFLCPGLLGTIKAFKSFIKNTDEAGSQSRTVAIKNLVRPYLLRRLKTDKTIITDLPEKTEVPAYCSLTKTQAVLYQQSVEELTQRIDHLEGIQRRGVVLSYLMRFKQICNHPSQWLADGRYEANESGKFRRLLEICEAISAKQEKVLIFTQFREMTGPLSEFLQGIFGRSGLVLHGETPVKKRRELVDAFQEERGPPFFVLSLKAGGTGLNLTAASHVIHFDRWWNPAVENQATDRAFRIGQKKNILVHKFICRGTIEEKIDALISSKLNLSKEILEGSDEPVFTELSNKELIDLVSLDIQSAVEVL